MSRDPEIPQEVPRDEASTPELTESPSDTALLGALGMNETTRVEQIAPEPRPDIEMLLARNIGTVEQFIQGRIGSLFRAHEIAIVVGVRDATLEEKAIIHRWLAQTYGDLLERKEKGYHLNSTTAEIEDLLSRSRAEAGDPGRWGKKPKKDRRSGHHGPAKR